MNVSEVFRLLSLFQLLCSFWKSNIKEKINHKRKKSVTTHIFIRCYRVQTRTAMTLQTWWFSCLLSRIRVGRTRIILIIRSTVPSHNFKQLFPEATSTKAIEKEADWSVDDQSELSNSVRFINELVIDLKWEIIQTKES